MADFRVFITASSADFKVVNELLANLRDWEYGSGDTFCLQTSNTIDEREKTSETPVTNAVAIPGAFTAETFENVWAGASIEEVEAFAARELDSIASPRAHVSFFLVLDEHGVEDHTVLCVAKEEPDESDGDDNHNNDEDEDRDGVDGKRNQQPSFQAPDNDLTRYNKVGMPWHAAYLFCANLGESNMGFEEFCDEGVGPDERLFWRVNEDLTGDDNGEDALSRREKFLLKLRKDGKI